MTPYKMLRRGMPGHVQGVLDRRTGAPTGAIMRRYYVDNAERYKVIWAVGWLSEDGEMPSFRKAADAAKWLHKRWKKLGFGTFEPRYVMALAFKHPITENKVQKCAPDLAVVYAISDDGRFYIGQFEFGLGLYNVHFPINSVRDLNDAEIKKWDGGFAELSGLIYELDVTTPYWIQQILSRAEKQPMYDGFEPTPSWEETIQRQQALREKAKKRAESRAADQ